MKWFKHDSDASNDAKLKKLRLKYGAQGYGIYWYCLELIARNVEKRNLAFELEHDAELIADDFKLSADIVQHIMTYMVELELFENTDGIISCLKMASRTDEYTQKLLKNTDKLPTISRQYPDVVPTISVLREEKRREEKYNAASHLVSLGVDESIAKDWVKTRKEKKLASTKTAIDGVIREAKKSGKPMAEVIRICCEQGWGGFKASWLTKLVDATPTSGSSLRGLPGMVS